jgi:hypothetical protein
VANEIVERRNLESHSSGHERRPSKISRQQRDRPDLQHKAAHAYKTEHTAPPKIDGHTWGCEKEPQHGSWSSFRFPVLDI